MTSDRDAQAQIRQSALRLLARREHSAQELRRKLDVKGFHSDVVNDVLAALADEGLLSDQRFAEAYVYQRMEKGYGPLRIQHELRERGIDEILVTDCLAAGESEWLRRLEKVRKKRFGAPFPVDVREKRRQWQFLQYRGFTAGQIRRALRDND